MSYDVTIKELLDYPFEKLSRRFEQHLRVYEICAEDFLEFAKEDSKGQDLRFWVNALGNVKRAIECRVDSLLYNYCLHKKSKKEHWDFPTKIEVIRELGIVAPRILTKINKKRNELEHRYVKPAKDDVDDAIDVGELFLNATSKQTLVECSAPKDFKIELKREEGFVKLIDYGSNIEKAAEINDDEGWIEFAKRLSRFLKPSQIRFHKSERS